MDFLKKVLSGKKRTVYDSGWKDQKVSLKKEKPQLSQRDQQERAMRNNYSTGQGVGY